MESSRVGHSARLRRISNHMHVESGLGDSILSYGHCEMLQIDGVLGRNARDNVGRDVAVQRRISVEVTLHQIVRGFRLSKLQEPWLKIARWPSERAAPRTN